MAFTSGMWYEMGMFISNPITSRLFEFWGRKRRICEAQPTSITSGSIFTQHNCGEIGRPQQDTNVKHDSDISSKDMTLLKLEGLTADVLTLHLISKLPSDVGIF